VILVLVMSNFLGSCDCRRVSEKERKKNRHDRHDTNSDYGFNHPNSQTLFDGDFFPQVLALLAMRNMSYEGYRSRREMRCERVVSARVCSRTEEGNRQVSLAWEQNTVVGWWRHQMIGWTDSTSRSTHSCQIWPLPFICHRYHQLLVARTRSQSLHVSRIILVL
jgi:hypothetical protein